ncbi:Melanoma inhibitory activity protein 3 [Camponotus floridanus]|uniref:Melanoma inhibitory activity protein 3 n=1 Tax=Camponotus floridanus TaxID=104421 RepID=E2AXV6_CAMFO|nr:Melanoma inhibitory activity protein 3 [Camponotus floridanus]
MTEIRSFMNLLFSLVLIILCIISQCLAALSDKQLCYNPDCSEPISLAKTAIVYISNDREVMSFNAGTEVKVFSKGAGKRTDLWGVEINGKRGFAPRSLLVEYKVLQRKLQYEVPVYKFTGEVNEVQPTELESRTEEKHKTHPLLKNKLLHDIEATSKSVKSIDESIVQESQVINVDNIISYEVIDGTTLYSDNEPSIQPNFVSKVVQATALPNEQASIDFIDSKINPDHKEPLSDKSTFIKKELQTDANDANGKLDKTKLSLDVHKETSTEILLENSAGLISLTLDTVSKDDTLIYDEGNKSEDELSTNLEHKEKSDNKIKTDNNAEESIEDNKKEEIMESVESKDIFASFTETFKMFSSSQDTTESTTIQNDDIPVSKAENNFQLKQVSEDIEAKDIASEKHIPTIQTELDSSIDSSLISKEKIEIQQEIIHENIESANVLDEKTKIEKEASIILLENATSSSDVPLSNNFVHKDTAKPAKKLPTTSSIEVDDSTTSSKTDINNIKNIQIGETSKEEKIIENIEDIDGSFVKDSIISGLKETTVIKSASTQSNSEVEQKLSENDKTHPEEDVSHTKTFDQVTINNKISETTNLSPETAIKENTKELFSESHTVEKNVMIDESLNHSATDISFIEKFVYSNVNKNDNSVDSLDNVPIEPNQFSNDVTPGILDSDQSLDSSQKEISNQITNFNEILQNQNLSDVEEDLEHEKDQFVSPVKEKETLLEYDDYINSEDKVLYKDEYTKEDNNLKKPESKSISDEIEDKVPSFDEYTNEVTTEFLEQKEESENEEDNLIDLMKLDNNYWKTLMFLCVTSVTVLVFTLGYYYIENIRRDKQLIARINTLEKEQLDLTLYIESIQEALSTQNESTEHNSNRFYEAKHRADKAEEEKTKLEEQVTVLEKDLENATEAGLELERMLREVLSSNNEINPLAQSVEDLKARLDAQQTANESLTNALNLKAQELVMEKSLLYKELKGKEIEIKELMEIVNQVKSNNLDLEKLYDVSHIKVDAQQLREERDELKMRLSDVEGAHQLLEEHMKLVKEEITALSDQCKIAEKEKKDAETRLEVLSKFFKEKEAERQKEETMWLQKQGEVVSTVERIHTMQSEIQNYKQQIEILKREIMDQEREYKNQISALETKAHEQWNDFQTGLEANGETVTSPPLFMGAESSSSPVMFSGSSGVPPPPPPSYLHCFPPYLPPLPPTTSGLPPYDISQRPPPLGGRLSSPPPMPPPLHPQLTSGGRYENTSSPPPPMTPPHLLPSFNHHRSPLSLPFGDDRIPPLPPPGFPPPLGTTHPWGEESLPVPRNSGFHPHQREQRARNHKGSLHSSGESLDQKAHHGKI